MSERDGDRRFFRRFDAGVVGRPAGGDKADCQVRALATARSIPYADAWALLYAMQGEVRHCGFTLVDGLAAGDPRLGVVRRIDFPAVKGKPRMTGAEFARRHPAGRFVLRMAHHVAAVKNGQVFDVFDSTSKCVYTAWEVSPSDAAGGGGSDA